MVPDRVLRVLSAYGLKALEFESGSTPTAELAAAAIGVAVGQIAKSILLAGADGGFRMVVLRGDRKISSSRMKKIAGCKHRLATAEETREATGYLPGGVCPFALEGVDVYVDGGLAQFDVIYPAAGTDATGVPITFEQLVAITGGRVDDVTGEGRH